MKTIKRPSTEEYNTYFQHYIDLTPEEALKAMELSMDEASELFELLGNEKGLLKYAPTKWTINEVISHVTDCERIFNYRALSFSRGDLSLPGFDHDEYVKHCGANDRTTRELIEELAIVRKATITLFNSFSETQLTISGKANGNAISVRALAYLIAGHQRHHFQVIKEKYLV
jgi:hypothetical protein